MLRRSAPVLLLALAAGPAAAGDVANADKGVGSDPILHELRLGLFAHDPGSPEQGSADVNGEVVFTKPFARTDWLDTLIPRPHLGATVSTGGATSSVYTGFTWHVPLGDTFFVEGSLGAALHNGSERGSADKNALGCSPLFRESASAGFRFARHWMVMATIEHLSNAGLCDENRGLTNMGVRVGYRF
jgi:lipid A 3-O-deacylase